MAAVTVLDLITETLALYGEYSPGEALDAAAVQSLLFTLNGAIDGIGAENLAIYQHSALTFSLGAGKQSYTLGPDAGNDWITTAAAPSQITSAGTLAASVELPVAIVGPDEWARMGLKSLQSTIASALWPQYGPVAHVLNFWPVPSAAAVVKLYTSQQVPAFTSSTDTVLLPAGFQEFLIYDLAIKSASKFGATLPEWIPAAWREAKTRIKERNYVALDARLDPALSRGSGRGFPSLKFYTGGN